MLGFELVSSGAAEMKDPARDVPRSIFISGFIIITLYILGTVAMLAAIPAGDINLVEGLMDTLYLFLGDSQLGQTAALILGVAALFTYFSNGVTWALGCNRAAAEAAIEGELPSIFALEHKTRGTPLGAAVAMGVISTAVLIMYGFMAGSSEELFWDLFSFSAVIFLLPYQGMLLAFVRMRIVDADHHRPYKIGGGLAMAKLCAYTCMLVLGLTIVLFLYTPGEGIQWPVFIGVLFTLAIGEVLIRKSDRA